MQSKTGFQVAINKSPTSPLSPAWNWRRAVLSADAGLLVTIIVNSPCGTDGRLLLSGFQALVTLTLDWVSHRPPIYTPNFIEIGKKFVDGRTYTYGRTSW